MFWQTLWWIVTTLQESLGLHWYFLSGWDMSGDFRTALQMVLPTGWSHSSLPKKCVWTSVGYNLTFLLPLPLLSLRFVVLVPLFYPESQLVIPEIAGADVCVWAAMCQTCRFHGVPNLPTLPFVPQTQLTCWARTAASVPWPVPCTFIWFCCSSRESDQNRSVPPGTLQPFDLCI